MNEETKLTLIEAICLIGALYLGPFKFCSLLRNQSRSFQWFHLLSLLASCMPSRLNCGKGLTIAWLGVDSVRWIGQSSSSRVNECQATFGTDQ